MKRWMRWAVVLAPLVMSVACGGSGDAAPSNPVLTKVELATPAPLGANKIGTTLLHLLDTARSRELMVSVWYPAAVLPANSETAPWMAAAALARFRTTFGDAFSEPSAPPGPIGEGPPPSGAPGTPIIGPSAGPTPVNLDTADFPQTHALQNVAVKAVAAPVLLFSPGFGMDREVGTSLVEDLASQGYVVVTLGHTFDAPELEFPNGRIELGKPASELPPHVAVGIRRADATFVLDQLAAIAAGSNPDVDHKALPIGLAQALDLGRVGMFGHSLGGAAVAHTMANDARVKAGANLDGSIFPDVDFLSGRSAVQAALELLGQQVADRPFLFVAGRGAGPEDFGDLVVPFWNKLPGWKRFLSLANSTHLSFTDYEVFAAQMRAGGIDIPVGANGATSIEPERAVYIQRRYLSAFFDLWLRNEDQHLLDAASAQFPEVAFR